MKPITLQITVNLQLFFEIFELLQVIAFAIIHLFLHFKFQKSQKKVKLKHMYYVVDQKYSYHIKKYPTL